MALYCIFMRHLRIRDFPTFAFSGCCQQNGLKKRLLSELSLTFLQKFETKLQEAKSMDFNTK